MKDHIYRTINVKYDVPPELLPVLDDFKSMVNWLISWGLYVGRPKNPNRDRYWRKGKFDRYLMCEETTPWFDKNWYSNPAKDYPAHYHEAACAVACQHLDSWLALGGNTSGRPYLSSSSMRLRKELFKATLEGDRLKVRVCVSPHRFVEFETNVHHGLLKVYRQGKIGEMTFHEKYLDLVFAFPDNRSKAKKKAGADRNLGSISFALDDRIETVSLAKVNKIRDKALAERKRIQLAIPKNSQKQWKILRQRGEREHNRVKDVIRKEIVPEIHVKTKGYQIAWDDLRQTTQECIIDNQGKRFHERLSSWCHGQIQEISDDKSPYRPLKPVFTRGTSTYCPFDGKKLTHPTWKESKCEKEGVVYDRDALSSVSTKVRSMYFHKKGEPWKLAKEILPRTQVRALSKAALFKVLPKEQVVPHLSTEKRDIGRSPSQDGGFPQNAGASVWEAASLTKDESPESPYGEVGQNDGMAAQTRPEDLCRQVST